MIVKFHARGRGGGSGPVNYLLGKERNREGASVLQGKPEEVRELIDASPYVKKYTSGVLSFAEQDLAPGEREKVMDSFERVLLPGLDRDQYSVLWVEHQDKGRLELNFVIPNTELLTGHRLQPYFDRADRPRIDAWQTTVNARLGLHDPNAPENRRTLVTPGNLPKTKQEASQTITNGLLRLCESGEVQTRHDVVQALSRSGFNVVRTTQNSISIADPDGGQNIRLRGALYEQSFEAGDGLRAEIERAAAVYRADAESRLQRAREVCRRGTELKRAENQRRYRRPQLEGERVTEGPQRGDGERPAEQQERRVAHDRSDMAEHQPGHVSAHRNVRRGAVVAERPHRGESGGNYPAEGLAGEAERADVGHPVSRGRERPLSGDARGHEWSDGLDTRQREGERGETGEGVKPDDGTGKTVAERVRAATAGLLEKAGRVGARLRGMAEDVWHYATGEREAERSRKQLESACAELKRAGDALEPSVMRHEFAVYSERQQRALEQEQRQKEHVRERTYRGPTIG